MIELITVLIIGYLALQILGCLIVLWRAYKPAVDEDAKNWPIQWRVKWEKKKNEHAKRAD